MLRRLTTAVAFLTRIPVNPTVAHDGADVARSSLFFPLIGSGLAVVQLFVMFALNQVGVPFLLQALAATVVLVFAGGALHQDGLADMADGFGGGFTKDKVLHIMRDSTIGTYGGLALILSVSTRVACLTIIASIDGAWPWVIAAAALSRGSILLGWLMPYARDAGTGHSLTQLTGPFEVTGALASAALIAFVCVGLQTFAALVAAAAVFTLMAWICHRKIGGVTGDTLGATTEVSEVFLLALGATLVSS